MHKSEILNRNCEEWYVLILRLVLTLNLISLNHVTVFIPNSPTSTTSLDNIATCFNQSIQDMIIHLTLARMLINKDS